MCAPCVSLWNDYSKTILCQRRTHTGDNTTCGAWRSTPPSNLPAAAPQWRYVKPWTLESPSQFRLPPPPDYSNSTIYRDAYTEVMLYGRDSSAYRTETETMIANFWRMNVAVYANELTRKVEGTVRTACTCARTLYAETYPPSTNGHIPNTYVQLTVNYDIVEAARYLMVNAIAFADMQIGGWDTKYTYNYWRPITAIRLGNW